MIKVGINGFGRIGRFVFRAAQKRNDLNIVSLHCSAEYETSDTSESINTYFNHFV